MTALQIIATCPGSISLAPLLPPSAAGPENQRTAPYTFAELAERWGCDERTVRRRVGPRFIKPGRSPMVRVPMVLRIEEQLQEGS